MDGICQISTLKNQNKVGQCIFALCTQVYVTKYYTMYM